MDRLEVADGTRIACRWDGDASAPVLVLAHALGTHHGMWDPQIPALAAHFRVLRFDARGHGASDVPAGPYDLATLGRDVLGLLDGLGVSRASFVGLSMGGMIGMWVAANAPERLERLVLASTSAHMGGVPQWNQRIETVLRDGMPALTEGILERWFTPGFRTAHPEEVERIRAMLLSCPREGYAGCAAAVRDMDLRDSLARIRAPTLVLYGRHDPSTGAEHAELIARATGAPVVALEAAHLANVEAEADFTATVLDFLT